MVDGDDVVLHLARPNPIWAAIDENPTVVLSVAGDWVFVPSSWKAIGDEDPRVGVPTPYYGAVQLTARAEVIDDSAGVAAVLRRQLQVLQPEIDAIDPSEHGARLGRSEGSASSSPTSRPSSSTAATWTRPISERWPTTSPRRTAPAARPRPPPAPPRRRFP